MQSSWQRTKQSRTTVPRGAADVDAVVVDDAPAEDGDVLDGDVLRAIEDERPAPRRKQGHVPHREVSPAEGDHVAHAPSAVRAQGALLPGPGDAAHDAAAADDGIVPLHPHRAFQHGAPGEVEGLAGAHHGQVAAVEAGAHVDHVRIPFPGGVRGLGGAHGEDEGAVAAVGLQDGRARGAEEEGGAFRAADRDGDAEAFGPDARPAQGEGVRKDFDLDRRFTSFGGGEGGECVGEALFLRDPFFGDGDLENVEVEAVRPDGVITRRGDAFGEGCSGNAGIHGDGAPPSPAGKMSAWAGVPPSIPASRSGW
jgi:hypothetical protein